jgi:4-hydroxybenzoate polyprenyltransferase
MLSTLVEYAHLVRFSHTLFALPFALASMIVAAKGLPSWQTALLILACMATARSGAMGFNRLADASLDALNPRTAGRHIPSGRMGRVQVGLFVAVNGALFVFFAWLLNPLAFLCSAPVFLLLLSYSYWKRFSFLAHWFLGCAIGMSPLGAWIAVTGEFALFPVLLGVILMLWMGGFDIIYATQDEEIDRQMGLHSIPARFGQKNALRIALASHILMLAVAVFFGAHFELPWPWWAAFACMALAIFYIHGFRKSNDLDALNRDFFVANVAVSLLVLLGLGGCVYAMVP